MAIRSLIGMFLAAAGIAIIAMRGQWAEFAYQFVPDNAFGTILDLAVPFVPILLIASGAWVAVRARR